MFEHPFSPGHDRRALDAAREELDAIVPDTMKNLTEILEMHGDLAVQLKDIQRQLERVDVMIRRMDEHGS